MKSRHTVVAFDYRGHGDNLLENPTDLSETTLMNDTVAVLKHLHTKFPTQTIILVGHSMGGALACKVVDKLHVEHATEEVTKQVMGVYVIDVCEGSAMDALPFMENIIDERPKAFKSVQDVIKWALKTQTVRNIYSARVSMPQQVKEVRISDDAPPTYVWKTDLKASKVHWEGQFVLVTFVVALRPGWDLV